jgi:hypothetical protein
MIAVFCITITLESGNPNFWLYYSIHINEHGLKKNSRLRGKKFNRQQMGLK